MEFEKIKIACVCEQNIVQGLEWALEQSSHLEFRFELVSLSLREIPQVAPEVDLYFFNLDLGQPLPVESLKAFQGKPGLVTTLHPTPHQLLSCFEVPGLQALAWNGQTFEEVISRLEQLVHIHLSSLKKTRFLDHLKTWILTQNTWPSLLLWSNSKTSQENTFYFDEKVPLTIGGAQSGCEISLEDSGAYKLAEFIFFDGSWRFRVLQKDLPVGGSFDPTQLKAGDFIEINHHTFFIKEHPLLENLSTLLKQNQLHFSDASHQSLRLQDEGLSLTDLCKRLMIQNRTGELRVQTAGKYGSIFFVDGHIEDATTGSSVGKKALLRILGWEQSRWKLNVDARKEYESSSLNLDLAGFLSIISAWVQESQRLTGRTPPQNIRVGINPQTFMARTHWTYNEVLVLGAIAESERVYEIVNSCSMEDHLIQDYLIQFRKQNLISVLV